MGLFPEAVLGVVYAWLAVAFCLMMTVFHHRRLAAKLPDDRAYYRYFLLFSGAFMAVPILIIGLGSADPAQFLSAAAGFTPGKWRIGLALSALAVPFCLVAAFIGSRDPLIQAYYPFSKRVCASAGKLAVFETSYVFLYYLPWEFIFRGLLFFPVAAALGLVPALAVQTALSTFYHFGHPDSEVFGAFGVGFVFGLIAYATGSFFYTIFIHAVVGVATDVLLYRRHYRRPAGDA
jgi:membrane protease YdiL (CAAX protease family)